MDIKRRESCYMCYALTFHCTFGLHKPGVEFRLISGASLARTIHITPFIPPLICVWVVSYGRQSKFAFPGASAGDVSVGAAGETK